MPRPSAANVANRSGRDQRRRRQLREVGEGEQIGHRLLKQRRGLGEARGELVDDPAVLLVHGGGVGLGERSS